MPGRITFLFEPIKIRDLVIPNRIMSTAHSTRFCVDGLVTDRLIAYQRERAKGGVGLIVTEAQTVHPSAQPRLGMIHNWDDRVIPGLRLLTDAVHEYETKIFGQLIHWPTIPTLVLFPVIVLAYLRLARKEETQMTERFGKDYLTYRSQVPMFFPRRGQWRRLLEQGQSSTGARP